jgi:hypothetical protein
VLESANIVFTTIFTFESTVKLVPFPTPPAEEGEREKRGEEEVMEGKRKSVRVYGRLKSDTLRSDPTGPLP